MGHKVHPLGFRIGVIRDWQAKWYAEKDYADSLHEDLKLRQAIKSGYSEAGISLVEIDRQANKVAVTIHTARPGVVIGRGGQRVDETRLQLESLIGKRIQLNVLEGQQPELDAQLVARAIADQIEHRIAFRRAMKQSIFRTMQAGAKGIRISCAGRLGGVEIARREVAHQGQVPLHTLRADIDYGFTEARTTLGRIGVKVWIYRGDILPEPSRLEVEEAPAEVAAQAEVETKPPITPEPEEKPAKAEKKVKEKKEVAEAKAEKKVKEKAEVAKPEEKTPRRKTRKTTKAEPPVTEEKEETDATTQAGEIPQES